MNQIAQQCSGQCKVAQARWTVNQIRHALTGSEVFSPWPIGCLGRWNVSNITPRVAAEQWIVSASHYHLIPDARPPDTQRIANIEQTTLWGNNSTTY